MTTEQASPMITMAPLDSKEERSFCEHNRNAMQYHQHQEAKQERNRSTLFLQRRCFLGFLPFILVVVVLSNIEQCYSFSATIPFKRTPSRKTEESFLVLSPPESSSLVSEGQELPLAKKNMAIVLNTNAAGVSKSIVKAVQDHFSSSNSVAVHVTKTSQEAKEAAQSIIQSSIPMVVPVGGDGTLIRMIQNLVNATEATTLSSSDLPSLPYVAYIPAGTGNAAGSVVACQASSPHKWNVFKRVFRRKQFKRQQVLATLHCLQQVADQLQAGVDMTNVSQVDLVDLPMMEISTSKRKGNNSQQKKDLCFFAGVGFDSLLLEHYQEVQEWNLKTQWPVLRGLLKHSAVFGYTAALICKTLPAALQRNAHELQKVQITAPTNSGTVWVDHRRGDMVRPVSAQFEKSDTTLLYEGRAGIVAGATLPYYGGGLRLFPFARMTTDQLHLRVGRIHPLAGVVNIPNIFQGTYRNGEFGCLDFLGKEFTISVSKQPNQHDSEEGYPLQHSGEFMGSISKFTLRVLPTPVKFVTFLPRRIVREEDHEEDEQL